MTGAGLMDVPIRKMILPYLAEGATQKPYREAGAERQ